MEQNLNIPVSEVDNDWNGFFEDLPKEISEKIREGSCNKCGAAFGGYKPIMYVLTVRSNRLVWWHSDDCLFMHQKNSLKLSPVCA